MEKWSLRRGGPEVGLYIAIINHKEKKEGFVFLGTGTKKMNNCAHLIFQLVVSLFFPVKFEQTVLNKRTQPFFGITSGNKLIKTIRYLHM